MASLWNHPSPILALLWLYRKSQGPIHICHSAILCLISRTVLCSLETVKHLPNTWALETETQSVVKIIWSAARACDYCSGWREALGIRRLIWRSWHFSNQLAERQCSYSLGRAGPGGGTVVGFSLIYSLSLSEGMGMSGGTGTGDGLCDINSQVSFLMKCKGKQVHATNVGV